MTRNFGDFVRWYSDNPDKRDFELKVSRELKRASKNGEGDLALYTLMEDVAINVLRSYLEWNRG